MTWFIQTPDTSTLAEKNGNLLSKRRGGDGLFRRRRCRKGRMAPGGVGEGRFHPE